MAKPEDDSKDYLDPKRLLEHQRWLLCQIKEELKLLKDEDGHPLPQFQEHFLKIICQLSAIGFSSVKISKQLGMNRKHISQILKSQSVQREILRLQDEMFKNPKQIFQNQLADACTTIYKIMMSKYAKDTNRIEAAKIIIERVLGKPTQVVENQHTLLRDVMDKLNAEISKEPIDDAEIIIPKDNSSQEEEKTKLEQSEDKVDPLENLLLEHDS